MTIKKIVDDDGNVKYAVVANSENRMYDYLSKWHDAYICKKLKVNWQIRKKRGKEFQKIMLDGKVNFQKVQRILKI